MRELENRKGGQKGEMMGFVGEDVLLKVVGIIAVWKWYFLTEALLENGMFRVKCVRNVC